MSTAVHTAHNTVMYDKDKVIIDNNDDYFR